MPADLQSCIIVPKDVDKKLIKKSDDVGDYWLEGLELDIFIPELDLGIEYQGVQHFKPVEHWGGMEALKELQVRDKKKRQLCQSLGIGLIYFKHDEDLSNESVSAKLGILQHARQPTEGEASSINDTQVQR